MMYETRFGSGPYPSLGRPGLGRGLGLGAGRGLVGRGVVRGSAYRWVPVAGRGAGRGLGRGWARVGWRSIRGGYPPA
jgi:hypothetical protein